MPVTTRRSLLAAVGVSLASAGCLTDSGTTGEATTESAATSEVTTDETSTPDDPVTERPEVETTTDESGNEAETVYASKSPDPDHDITLRNRADETRVRVWVVREETGETVFETTESDAPAERTLYNLRQADPEGIEAFRVCAELVGSGGGETESAEDSPQRDCATIRTSECYGDAHVTIQEGGSVRIVYAVC